MSMVSSSDESIVDRTCLFGSVLFPEVEGVASSTEVTFDSVRRGILSSGIWPFAFHCSCSLK